MMQLERGFFVALEGGEGGGKSTQANVLLDWLNANGQKTEKLREPGTGELPEAIRNIVLNYEMQVQTQALLYSAARSEFVARSLRPMLDSGVNAISERFAASTLVYQGIAGGIDLETLKILIDFSTGGLEADHYFLLDLPVEVGLSRKSGIGQLDVMERKGNAFHQTVRDGYLEIARSEPERWTVVDATAEMVDVTKILKGTMADLGFYNAFLEGKNVLSEGEKMKGRD